MIDDFVGVEQELTDKQAKWKEVTRFFSFTSRDICCQKVMLPNLSLVYTFHFRGQIPFQIFLLSDMPLLNMR